MDAKMIAIRILEADFELSRFLRKASDAGIEIELDIDLANLIFDLLGIPEENLPDEGGEWSYGKHFCRDWAYEILHEQNGNPEECIMIIEAEMAEFRINNNIVSSLHSRAKDVLART